MRSRIYGLSGLWGVMCFCVLHILLVSAEAQLPKLINYQGRLVSTNLIQGDVSLVMRLYTNATTGSYEYEDSNTVTVVDGLYSTYIGDDSTFGVLTDALTNNAVYLQLTVNGTTLLPRERLTSVPYALVAERLVNDSAEVGIDGSDIATLDDRYVNLEGDTMTGELNIVGGENSGDYMMELWSGTNLVGWARKK